MRRTNSLGLHAPTRNKINLGVLRNDFNLRACWAARRLFCARCVHDDPRGQVLAALYASRGITGLVIPVRRVVRTVGGTLRRPSREAWLALRVNGWTIHRFDVLS